MDTVNQLITLEAMYDPQRPVQADAALYFLPDGHFMLSHLDGGHGLITKFLAPEDVAAAMSSQTKDSGWLGEGIMRAGRGQRGDWFVYRVPAWKLTLHLTTLRPGPITIPIPATVLIGVGPSYYLFAAKDSQVTPRSQIFKAPFPNIYSNGRICWGNNQRPPANPLKAASVWKLFFETPFNNHLSNGKSESCDKDVNEKLVQLADSHARQYPARDLVRIGATLERAVEKILNRDWSD